MSQGEQKTAEMPRELRQWYTGGKSNYEVPERPKNILRRGDKEGSWQKSN